MMAGGRPMVLMFLCAALLLLFGAYYLSENNVYHAHSVGLSYSQSNANSKPGGKRANSKPESYRANSKPESYRANSKPESSRANSNTESNAGADMNEEIVKQRNMLSKELNKMRKTVGQMQCEASKQSTDAQGGWCRSTSKENSGSHVTDQAMLKGLSNFFSGKKVASFGDGPGAYRRGILQLKQVASFDSYDGAPFCEEVTEGNVQFLDLTVPQYNLPLYDWVMSLEVAEHIPKNYESVYLDNVFRHANEGIVLSWAIPGQGGLGHINEKAFADVKSIMEQNGFSLNSSSSALLQKAASVWWLKRNTYVYSRKNYGQFKNEAYLRKWHT